MFSSLVLCCYAEMFRCFWATVSALVCLVCSSTFVRIIYDMWYDMIFSFWLSGTLAINPECQCVRKSKTKNDRSASLASNPLVTVPILELWVKCVKTCHSRFVKQERTYTSTSPSSSYLRRQSGSPVTSTQRQRTKKQVRHGTMSGRRWPTLWPCIVSCRRAPWRTQADQSAVDTPRRTSASADLALRSHDNGPSSLFTALQHFSWTVNVINWWRLSITSLSHWPFTSM